MTWLLEGHGRDVDVNCLVEDLPDYGHPEVLVVSMLTSSHWVVVKQVKNYSDCFPYC